MKISKGIFAAAIALTPFSTIGAQTAQAWQAPEALKPCVDFPQGSDIAKIHSICAELLSSGQFSGTDATVIRLYVLLLGHESGTLDDRGLSQALSTISGASLPSRYRNLRNINLSGACERLQNWTCARSAYEDAWSTNTFQVEWTAPFAAAIVKSGNAENYIDALFAKDPDWIGSFFLRSEVRHLLGDAPGAFADIKSAAKLLKPGNHATANSICWDLVTRYQAASIARVACDIAVSGSEENAMYLDSRGVMSLALGDYQSALRDLDRALALSPDLHTTRYARGLALEALGRGAEGAAEKRRALSGDASLERTFANYKLAEQNAPRQVSAPVTAQSAEKHPPGQHLHDTDAWKFVRETTSCELSWRAEAPGRNRTLIFTLEGNWSYPITGASMRAASRGEKSEPHWQSTWEVYDTTLIKFYYQLPYPTGLSSGKDVRFTISRPGYSETRNLKIEYERSSSDSYEINGGDEWLLANLDDDSPTTLVLSSAQDSEKYIVPPLRGSRAEFERCRVESKPTQ